MFKCLNLPVPSKHSEYIHFSCSLLLICGFISRSAFGLMQSSPSCSTDLSLPKLSWNIYFYNIIMSINVSICMYRLTSTTMSWGMLGFLTLTISPWQGSSLAGVERIMSPTLGTSNDPSRLHLFYFSGSLGHQLSSLLSLGWLPWQRSSLAGVEWIMSPTLGTSSGLSSSYKKYIFTSVHRSCFY